MRVGLLGFRGSGKSVLFDAIVRGRSAGGGGTARVATVLHDNDDRLDFLDAFYEPKKKTPLSFELHDYPGVPPPGTDEGAFRAGRVRDDVDGLVLVVRAFETGDYFYPRPDPDPEADARDLCTSLVLLDLEVVTRAVEKLETAAARPTPRQEDDRKRLALLRRVAEHLEADRPVKEMELTAEEERDLRQYGLLTKKPWLLLVSLPDGGEEGVAEDIEGPFESLLEVRVKLESELLDLDEEDRKEFLEDLGIEKLALPGILERLLPGLGMLRFYTGSEAEVHVWELERGGNAVAAAGKIHTDLARGFIRAEVVSCRDLMEAKTMAGARAAGKVRLEGKDYVVKDGDVLDIRFNV